MVIKIYVKPFRFHHISPDRSLRCPIRKDTRQAGTNPLTHAHDPITALEDLTCRNGCAYAHCAAEHSPNKI